MLRSTAVLLTGGAAGAAVATSSSGTAAAAEASLSVAGDEITVRNGSLAAVWLDLSAGWGYDLPSGEQPKRVEVDVLAGASEDEMSLLKTKDADATFLEADGTMSFSVDLLSEGVVSGEELVPSEGGETAETTVHVGVELRVLSESGLVIAADSRMDTATLTVTRSAYDPNEYGAVSGDGGLTIEVE